MTFSQREKEQDSEWHDRLTFGTYRQNGSDLETQLDTAIKFGFTRFDTAQLYKNEAAVGNIVRRFAPKSSYSAFHITTKVRRNSYPHVAHSHLHRSFNALRGENQVLDRVLLHRPMPCEQYRILEQHVSSLSYPSNHCSEIKIGEIGVSNFSVKDLEILLEYAHIKPCVNQVEFHPFVPRIRELLAFCKKHGVHVQGHTVLARGHFMSYQPLVELAQRKGATPAQVLLRFALDNGIDAVVRSSNPSHLEELITASRKDAFHLTGLEIAEMCTWSETTIGAPHIFYPRGSYVPPVAGISTSTNISEYIEDVANILCQDLQILKDTERSPLEVSDTVLSLPCGFSRAVIQADPICVKLGKLMFPNDSHPVGKFADFVKELYGYMMEKKRLQNRAERLLKVAGSEKACKLRGSVMLPSIVSYRHGDTENIAKKPVPKISQKVLEPRAMPVQVGPREEYSPFLQFLASRESISPLAKGAMFVRGTLFADGRMDMCKQVVGSKYIAHLCAAVRSAPPGKVRHFLLGNNIACDDDPEAGANAIANLMKDKAQGIETWYLAGNDINGVAIGILAAALKTSETAKALWLKRNPIKSDGAVHLASLLQVSKTLEILDLDISGLLDGGVFALLNPVSQHKGKISLRHLYLGGNGITETGAGDIANFLEAHSGSLETLYLSMNQLGDSGAVKITRSIVQSFRVHKRTPALRRLSFASCRLTDVSLPEIAKAVRVCRLICLDLGYHKATGDLGERGNVFSKAGVPSIIGIIETAPSLRFLGIANSGLDGHKDDIRNAARTTGKLWLEDRLGGKDAVRGGITDNELHVGIRHPECIANIASVYRGRV